MYPKFFFFMSATCALFLWWDFLCIIFGSVPVTVLSGCRVDIGIYFRVSLFYPYIFTNSVYFFVQISPLKGQYNEIFDLQFFHPLHPLRSLTSGKKYFRFWSMFRREKLRGQIWRIFVLTSFKIISISLRGVNSHFIKYLHRPLKGQWHIN